MNFEIYKKFKYDDLNISQKIIKTQRIENNNNNNIISKVISKQTNKKISFEEIIEETCLEETNGETKNLISYSNSKKSKRNYSTNNNSKSSIKSLKIDPKDSFFKSIFSKCNN